MKISELSPEYRISQLSPEYRPPPALATLLTDLNRVVADVEALEASDSSSLEKLAADLRCVLTNLASAASSSSSPSSGLNGAFRLKVWNLAFRLWNACVDRANRFTARGPEAAAAETEIRQAAPELLLVAGLPDGVPNATTKVASLFHRTGH